MKHITTDNKALELYEKFRPLIIDSKIEGVNDEMANSCALISANLVLSELERYAGNNQTNEIRPLDLSGRDFWQGVINVLKKGVHLK